MELTQVFEQVCDCLQWPEEPLTIAFEREKNMVACAVYFRRIRVDLVYSRKWEDLAPPSVLYARVYPNKNDWFYVQLHVLLGYLDKKDFRVCCFPGIENAERMAACVRQLAEIVTDHLEEMASFADSEQCVQLRRRWMGPGLFGGEDENVFIEPEPLEESQGKWMLNIQEALYVARVTRLKPYQAFLRGDREKALQGYGKLKKKGLLQYEWALTRFLESPESEGFVPMPKQCVSGIAWDTAKKQKVDLPGMAGCFVFFAIFFCALIAALNAWYGQGTVYMYTIRWHYGLVLAPLCALLGYSAFRRELLAGFPGLGHKKRQEMVATEKPAKTLYAIAKLFFGVVLVGCLVFCVSMHEMADRFYDTYGTYYSQLGEERFEYADVTQVYHISARYNEYGDRVERASCVLILADGRQIDLDGCGDADNQLAMVARLMPGVPVVEVDSDRDLP